MKNENKVLACVDQSRFADYVADYAACAARRMQAPLEFLHAIDRHPEVATGNDHSGAIGIDAQEHLLAELSGQDELRSKAASEQRRLFLNRLRERAIAAGVEAPDVRQRHGRRFRAFRRAHSRRRGENHRPNSGRTRHRHADHGRL